MADYIGTHDFSNATVIGAGGTDPLWEATVGASGADYTTLGAAITDGKVRILVIDDTTETGDITLPSNCLIQGIGRDAVNVDMATYKFEDNSRANSVFNIKDLKITYAYTSSKYLFDTFAFLDVDNVYFDNNSTSSSTAAIYYDLNTNTTESSVVRNCIFACPNYSYSGISVEDASCFTISDCTFIGGGSSSTYICYLNNCTATNLIFNGSTSTSIPTLSLMRLANVSNVYPNVPAFHINVSNNSNLSNVTRKYYGINTYTAITVSKSTVSNCTLDEGDMTIDLYSTVSNINLDDGSINISSQSTVSNIYGGGTTNFNITDDGNNLTNCHGTNLTISSGDDSNNVANCSFLGAVSITGNDTTMTGCRVGADAGGGSNTITVNSGANRTIISGCRTDAAIVDNGTDTATGTNVVY